MAARAPDPRFTTISGRPIEPLYRPADVAAARLRARPRRPGAASRSRAASTRRCTAAGSGRCASSPASARAEETNERFNYLLEHGADGLSTAFDMPTLMGHDSDHPLSLGEVGKCGVAVDIARRHGDAVRRHPARPGHHLDDDQRAGRDPARLLRRWWARSRACRRRSSRARSRPTSSRSSSPRRSGSSRRGRACGIVVDMIEYCTEHMPQWNTISISGYHIREAGSTAAQELAFTLRDGFAYVQWASTPASTSTTSRRGSPSSSTRTSTSSRRSPSSARRAGSGRAR